MTRPTATDLQRFREDGYLVVRGLFSRADVMRMRSAFDRLEARAQRLGHTRMHQGAHFVLSPGDPVRIHRVVWCGGAEPALGELGRAPQVLSLAAHLLDRPELDQLINQAHFKLPGDGVAFPWHQDSTHRRYGTSEWTDLDGRGSFVEIATALDPVTEENGPLRFVPGSHRLGHLRVGPDGALPSDAFDPSDAVTPLLKPGDAVVFGPFLIHGSEPNRSRQSRRMLLNGFALPGANRRIYPGAGTGLRVRVSTP